MNRWIGRCVSEGLRGKGKELNTGKASRDEREIKEAV